MSRDDVGRVRASAELLTGYLGAVHERTVAYLGTLGPDDLDPVVDDAWDPPVTAGAASSASSTTAPSTPARPATRAGCCSSTA